MSDNVPAKEPLKIAGGRRNEIIERLKTAFAHGTLGIEEYESRVERAEKSGTSEELETLVADLPKTIPDLLRDEVKTTAETDTLDCHMVTKNLSGTILFQKKLSITASMSTIRLDYRQAAPLKGLQEINLDLNMSNVTLYVPDSVGVENRVHESMSTFRESGKRDTRAPEIETLIRLVGQSKMSNIKVKRERHWFPSRKNQ